MTKNRRRNRPVNITSQGVKDLNSLGPRKPRIEADPAVKEILLNENANGGPHKTHHGLPDSYSSGRL
jgi:hypothetical protein